MVACGVKCFLLPLSCRVSRRHAEPVNHRWVDEPAVIDPRVAVESRSGTDSKNHY